MEPKKIRKALISVFHKDGLAEIVRLMNDQGITILSTGGTYDYIKEMGFKVEAVEDLTGYPSVFGGRVKTLHPAVFGGILQRADNDTDQKEAEEHEIDAIDLVIVDLYPFEETVAKGGTDAEIIEKIDIGGISLIRAAAKNHKDVVIIAHRRQYAILKDILDKKGAATTLAERRKLAAEAFDISSSYDTAIFSYFNADRTINTFKQSINHATVLRYGENPHQQGVFYGNLDGLFQKLNGKELSYNNLVDVDAAINLVDEFDETVFAIIKHTNACGVATGKTAEEAYEAALACDPVSAFGGVIATNATIDMDVAYQLHQLFFEVLIAPKFDADALTLLAEKKNRILLMRNEVPFAKKMFKTCLNGVLEQDKDLAIETAKDLKNVTKLEATPEQIADLVFANKIVKHTKSNAICIAGGGKLLATGVGQTSRVDALKHAIDKAKSFGFSLQGAVMASDAFFPFPDCVEIAAKEGIKAIIQPGGSVKDQDSIDMANELEVAMVFTGVRHFRH